MEQAVAIRKWMSIFGEVQIEGEEIIFSPPVKAAAVDAMPEADGGSSQAPHCVARSTIEFEQGTISWEVKLTDARARVQLLLSAEPSQTKGNDGPKVDSVNSEISVGLNVGDSPYGFSFWNGSWTLLRGAGHGSKLPLDKWIPLKLVVRGSTLDLYVDGVSVVSESHNLKRGQISVLFQSYAKCSIRNVTVVEDQPTCFAVMQFTEEFDVLYADVIRPVCESYGYKVIRGDDFYTSGQIMDDVTQSIRNAALVIADVTPNNANVFYEVGFAHAIGKATILLSDRKRDRLPFDISGFRTLFYDNTIGGKSIVEERLKQHLNALRPKRTE
jgi:hypothetical protein